MSLLLKRYFYSGTRRSVWNAVTAVSAKPAPAEKNASAEQLRNAIKEAAVRSQGHGVEKAATSSGISSAQNLMSMSLRPRGAVIMSDVQCQKSSVNEDSRVQSLLQRVTSTGCYAVSNGLPGAALTLSKVTTPVIGHIRMTEIGRPFCQPSLQLQSGFTSSLLSPPLTTLISGLTSTPTPFTEITRNVIKFSMRKGRRKTMDPVKNRFLRLDWGGWISTLPGRGHHLWKKSVQSRWYLRNHVLRSGKEVRLLNLMSTKYWIKKKHFVNDPYEPYHTRDQFPITKGVQGVDSINLYKHRQYSKRVNKRTY